MTFKNGTMPDCNHLLCDYTTNPGFLWHNGEIRCTVDDYLYDGLLCPGQFFDLLFRFM